MLIIKVWGIPTRILTHTAFSDVVESWKSQLALDVANFKPLSINKEQIHVLLPLQGHVTAPPKKLLAEINGPALRLATKKVSLTEIEKIVQEAIALWYHDTPLYVTANFDDNS
jgi:hypothetical protein